MAGHPAVLGQAGFAPMRSHCLRFVSVFPALKWSERWSHWAAVKITSRARGRWGSSWQVPPWPPMAGLHRSGGRNPTCSCPPKAVPPLLLGHLPPELAWQESCCLSAAFSTHRGALTHLAPPERAVPADTRLRSTEAGSQGTPMA